MGRWSEETLLLGLAKNRSNTDPNDQGDLLGSLSDKDVPQKMYKREGNPKKYLRESYYHCIECTIATFLTIFMWRRPLNSTALATATHRKLKWVSDRIGTQVRA